MFRFGSRVLQNPSDGLSPPGSGVESQSHGEGRAGQALTSGAIAMGVHEGEAQPLVLLQGALVREAPVHGTHHVGLLLAVVDSSLGHVHRLPAERGRQETWVLSWAGQRPEVGGEAPPSGGLEARRHSRSISKY